MQYLKSMNFSVGQITHVNDNKSNSTPKKKNLDKNVLKINKIPSTFRSMFIGIKGSGNGCGSCG